MRKKTGQTKGVVPTTRQAWRRRLRELGLNTEEWCYNEPSPDLDRFFKGETVFVLVDARPHMDGLGPVMTFWPAHADLRGLLKCMAILE